jgi:hypothetical protein
MQAETNAEDNTHALSDISDKEPTGSGNVKFCSVTL